MNMHVSEWRFNVSGWTKENFANLISAKVQEIVKFFPSLNQVWGKKVDEIAETLARLIQMGASKEIIKENLARFTETTGPDFDIPGGKIQHRAQILYDDKTGSFSISPFIYDVKLVIMRQGAEIVVCFQVGNDTNDSTEYNGNLYAQKGAELRAEFVGHLKKAA